jgi:hypothetical protein
MTTKVSDYPREQVISITDSTYGLNVLAPLPETLSIGAGSEIGSPFSSYATEGNASNILALATDSSQKIGITTKKLFMGPDQPDITLDLKFETYYSAFEEVILPCARLLFMATGEQRNLLEDLKNSSLGKQLDFFQKSEQFTAEVAGAVTGGDVVLTQDLISYLRAPGLTRIKFGRYFQIDNNYISNVSINFSNVLDYDYLPMEATASITITPQDPWVKNTLVSAFKGILVEPDLKNQE